MTHGRKGKPILAAFALGCLLALPQQGQGQAGLGSRMSPDDTFTVGMGAALAALNARCRWRPAEWGTELRTLMVRLLTERFGDAGAADAEESWMAGVALGDPAKSDMDRRADCDRRFNASAMAAFDGMVAQRRWRYLPRAN